jgi:hypothetical protein
MIQKGIKVPGCPYLLANLSQNGLQGRFGVGFVPKLVSVVAEVLMTSAPALPPMLSLEIPPNGMPQNWCGRIRVAASVLAAWVYATEKFPAFTTDQYAAR